LTNTERSVSCVNSGAWATAHEGGRRIPQDIAIAGYDDIPEAAVTYPALTTEAVPGYEIGRRAMELLLARIQGRGPKSPQRVELEHTLVIRAST